MPAVIDTKPGYRVFCEVVAQHGPRLSALAECCRLPRSGTRNILNGLISSGHICEVGKRFYVTNHGSAMVARHNRNHYQTVQSRITKVPTPGKANPTIVEKRNTAVNQVYRQLRRQGLMVYDGRRMGIGGLTGAKSWYPDLWLGDDESAVRPFLYAVLVEPSTRDKNAIKGILSDYRSAVKRETHAHFLFVIARDEAAARLFCAIGDDLPINVKTLGELLRG